MSTLGKVLLGVATLIQVPAIIFIVTMDDPPTAVFAPAVALAFAVWGFYFWDLPRNERVPEQKEADLCCAPWLTPIFAEPHSLSLLVWLPGG